MKNITFKRVVYHIIFWAILIYFIPRFYYLVTQGSFSWRPENIKDVTFYDIYHYGSGIYVIFAAYFISYYLGPKFLSEKKKYFLFILFYISTFAVITIFDIFFVKYTIIANYYPELFDNYISDTSKSEFFWKIIFMLHAQSFIFIAVRFFIQYLRSNSEKKKLKTKVVETELNNLKSQLHPHFLFNTLNNIYSLSLDTNDEELSTSIAKISEILRFSLYECDTEVIPLEKEVENISNYIELEKLRYSNIRIAFNAPEDTNGVCIIPLILFTFVENAFKHGAGKTIKNKWISINLFLTNNDLFFNVKNSKKSSSKKSSTTNFHNYNNGGIGISNSVKRLELFYGKNNYKLTINDEDTYFEIDLQLKLSNINKNPKDS